MTWFVYTPAIQALREKFFAFQSITNASDVRNASGLPWAHAQELLLPHAPSRCLSLPSCQDLGSFEARQRREIHWGQSVKCQAISRYYLHSAFPPWTWDSSTEWVARHPTLALLIWLMKTYRQSCCWLYPFAFSLAMKKRDCISTPLPKEHIVKLLKFC